MSYFDDAKFTFPKDSPNDINEWADYCELFCLLSENRSQTVVDRISDQFGDLSEALKTLRLTNSRTGKFIISSTAIILDVEDEEDEDEDNEQSDYGDVSSNQQFNAGLEDDIRNEFLFLMQFCLARKNLFGDFYPFNFVANRKIELESELSDKYKIYLSLLLSSVLRVYKKRTQNELGHLFEDVSFFVFKNLVPNTSVVEYFGAGNSKYPTSPFKGNFFQRTTILANNLHTDTTEQFKSNQHDYLDSGDRGLDWVAWLPLKDNVSHMPTFLAQCACGEDWVDKEFDASPDKWRNYIHFLNNYKLFHFIAKSFRKQDGQWYKPGEIYNVILIDRLRFVLNLAEDSLSEIAASYISLIDEASEVKLSAND
jgi:hypothetical protein